MAWNCSDSTSVMAMSFPITLGYLYTGPQSIAMPNSTVVGADRFTFALIDAEGRRSVPALYTIFASTSLLALSSPSSWIQPSAMQETEANITVRIFLWYYIFIMSYRYADLIVLIIQEDFW